MGNLAAPDLPLAVEGIPALRSSLQGNLLLPSDEAFKDALKVYTVSPFHKPLPSPALVVQPRGTADVVAAVKFARERGLPLAVRSGGHGPGNPSWADGGVTIDLSLMRSVYVDPQERTAVVDGGALLMDIDHETALHGLAAVLGICPTVGMGLILHGGLSLLSRTFGPACDGILEAQLVTADGSVLNVTEDGPDPELWWALHGAGAALGIVTKLKLRLHPTDNFYCGSMVWVDEAKHATYKAIMQFMRDTVVPNPDIGFNLNHAHHPELGPVIISMVNIVGDQSPEEKAALLKPLRDLGPIQDSVGTASWLETQLTNLEGLLGIAAAFPVRYDAWTAGFCKAEQFNEDFIDAYIRFSAEELPLPECAISACFLEMMGGSLKETQSPVGLKEGDLNWILLTAWSDPSFMPEAMSFCQTMRDTLGPLSYSTHQYVNLADISENNRLSYEEAAAKAGGPAALERLRAVKAKYDPQGVFANNLLKQVMAVEP